MARFINAVVDYQTPNDGSRDAYGPLQAAIDDLVKEGGRLYLPAGLYVLSKGLHIPSPVTSPPPFNNAISIVGDGMSMRESRTQREIDAGTFLPYGITVLHHRGSDSALLIGEETMQQSLFGIEIRDLSIWGTTIGETGIFFAGNFKGGMVYRCLVENVCVAGYDSPTFNPTTKKHAAGIRLSGLGNSVFRRVQSINNFTGFEVSSCIMLHCDGIVARGNVYGMFVGGSEDRGPVSGLSIGSQSLFESNSQEGMYVCGCVGVNSNTTRISVDNSRFGGNNKGRQGTKCQLTFLGSGDVPGTSPEDNMISAVSLTNLGFSSEKDNDHPTAFPAGDIYLQWTRDVLIQNTGTDASSDQFHVCLDTVTRGVTLWNVAPSSVANVIENYPAVVKCNVCTDKGSYRYRFSASS